MTLRIVADENIPALSLHFAGLGEIRQVSGRDLEGEHIGDADVLLVRSVTRVDEDLLAGTGIRFVGTATSGVDHVDREYLAARGIGFAHAPGANANSVVEYVLSAIADTDEKLEQLLSGGRVGIVGYGYIGRALAERLSALGIVFCAYDPWLPQDQIANPASLETVLESDVISLHPELTRLEPWPSYHLLGEAELSTLLPSQLLINASRGEIIDGGALLMLLQAGSGPSCVLDVWEGEPHIERQLLESVQFGSAHIAGYSFDGKLLGTKMLWRAVVDYFGLEGASSAVVEEPAPPLVVESNLAGAALVRNLLRQCYDIRGDDLMLRQAASGPAPGAAFDALRREYSIRRELRGREVSMSSYSPEQLTLIQGLGCRPSEECGP